MPDSIETAIYSLGADSSAYVDGMKKATAADQEKIDSAAKVATSEEKVTNALRASQQGLENRIARLDPAVKAEQDYAKALEYHSNIVAQGIGTQQQQAQYLQLVTEKYQTATSGSTVYGKALEHLQLQMVALSGGLGMIGVGLSAFGPWGFAAAAGIGLITEAFNAMSAAADAAGDKAIKLQAFSSITGLTVEQMHGLDVAAAEMGVGAESVERVMTRLTEGLNQARQGTGTLYDSVRALNPALAGEIATSKDTAAALNAIAKAYNDAADAAQKLEIAKAAGGGARGAMATSAILTGIGNTGGIDELAAHNAGAWTSEYAEALAKVRAENKHLAESNEDLRTKMYALPIEETKRKWLEYENDLLKNGSTISQGLWVDSMLAMAGSSIQALEAEKKLADQSKDTAAAQQEVASASTTASQAIASTASAAANASLGLNSYNAAWKNLPPEILNTVTALEAANNSQQVSAAMDGVSAASKRQIINALSLEANGIRDAVAAAGNAVSVDDRRIATLDRLKIALLEGKISQEQFNTAVAQSDTFTVKLNALHDQLAVAQAVTGVEKQNAQERANYNQFILQGFSTEQASVLAEQQKAVAIATVNSAAQAQLLTLQDQNAVANAVTGVEKARAQEQATINQLLRQGVDLVTAQAEGEQQFKNAMDQATSSAQAQLLSLRDQHNVLTAAPGLARQRAQEEATYNSLVRQGVDASTAAAVAEQQRANATAQANNNVRQQIQGLQDQVNLARARQSGDEASVQAAIAYRNAIQQGADATTAAALAATMLDTNLEKAQIAAEDAATAMQNAYGAGGGPSGGGGRGGDSTNAGTSTGIKGSFGVPGLYTGGGDNITGYHLTEVDPVSAAKEEKKKQDVAAAQEAERKAFQDKLKQAAQDAAKSQQDAGHAQQQAAQAQQQAAQQQAQAAADMARAAEELAKANDNAFRQFIASQIIAGANPLDLEHSIMSGAVRGGLPDTVFKEELDLEKRGKVNPQQTINEIKQGVIGQGVEPTVLLAAIDSLTQAIGTNTDAVNKNSDTKCPGISDLYFAGGGDASLKGLGYQAGSAGSASNVLSSVLPPGFTANPIIVPPTPTPTPAGPIMSSGETFSFTPFADGGIANTPQFALFGEADPEAFVPLKGGRIPVQLAGGKSGGDSALHPPITLNMTVASDVQANDFLKNEQQIMGMITRAVQSYVSHR